MNSLNASGKGILSVSRLGLAAAIAWACQATAQTCPEPVVANGTQCVVDPGTTVSAPANTVGLSASAGGGIAGNTVAVNLTGANATGALAQSAGQILLSSATVRTTSTAANANGQYGMRASGAGSRIEASDSSVLLVPGGTSSPANLHGVSAEAGAVMALRNTEISVRGGANALGSVGVQALGAGSFVQVAGGNIDTLSRGAFGVLAQGGGYVQLTGTQINTAGAQNTTTLDGSHAMVSRGAGSTVTANNVSASTTGALANLMRVDDGASAVVRSSTLSHTGSGNAATAAAAVRVTSGGTLGLENTGILTAGALYSPGLLVEGDGSNATVTGSSIEVGGARTFGVNVRTGGSVTLIDSTITQRTVTTTGPWSPGIQVEDANTTLTLQGGTVTTEGAPAYGVRALAGAAVSVDGTTIITSGANAAALIAGSATIQARNFTIQTEGDDNAMGALADLGATLRLTGGTITTRGNQVRAASFAHAMGARNPGGSLFAQGTVAHTYGTYAMGVWADDGGTASVQDVSVTTEGTGANGVLAIVEQAGSEFPATVTYQGGRVETFGDRAHGALAQARNDLAGELASISLASTPVTTHGNDAVGLRAVLANYGSTPSGRGSSRVQASNLVVTTTGTGAHTALSRDNPTEIVLQQVQLRPSGVAAHGAVAAIGGHVTGAATTVAPTGTDAMALYVVGLPGAVSQADFLQGSTLGTASEPAVGVAGNGRVGLTDTTVTADGEWLKVGTVDDFPALLAGEVPVQGPVDLPDDDGNLPTAPNAPPPGAPIPAAPGVADVSATTSTLTGSATTAPGSTSNLTLVDSLWRMTGSSNVTSLVNDPSRIEFSPPLGDPLLAASYKTLTVSTYAGDGTLAMNTWLGADDAPSDRLVVLNGTSDGPGSIEISNTVGLGDLTVANGITVVQAINSTTAVNNFSLAGPVVAGPFEYFLYRGAPGGQAADSDTANSWFLRSVIDCASPGAPSPPCPAPPPPPDPPTPPTPPAPPTPPPAPPTPAFRQEVSLIAAIPAMAAIYGRTLIDTLHERVGDLSLLRQRDDFDPDRTGSNGAWLRYVGHDGEHDGGKRGIYGARGPDFDYRFDALQIGLDLYRRIDANDASRTHAGLYLAYGKGKGEVNHNLLDYRFHAGTDRFVARTVGGYWTKFNDREAYLDAVAQYTSYDLRVQSLRLPDSFTNASGVALSLEGGWPFVLNNGDGAISENGRWRLEPQAQVIWQQVDVDAMDDPTVQVRFSDTDSLVGRLGARLNRNGQRESRAGEDRLSNAWLRANVWHEFRGEPRTEFATNSGYLPFAVDLGGSWGEVGIGGTWQVSETGYLYTDLDYSWSFDGDETGWNGKVGARWNW
ncbi:autotransporter outer membrane beta-barrel domain-containing protein [Stenotrophomonas bentonitica]|uniref:autotransporter outer membrane beta-barrel domain-containing protein n=1 Tax=Stenotrophomonas bentonitica TaxID=1450134 RepID=UPI00345ED32D